MLFLSQPLGVGFSYSEEELGSLNPYTGEQENSSYGIDGRWPVINASLLDTTDLAAIATWHVLQGFLSALPQLDSGVGAPLGKTFNLWTESYGGHYGPAFYNYFYDQNQKIANGTANGTQLNFDTLGLGNGTYFRSDFFPIQNMGATWFNAYPRTEMLTPKLWTAIIDEYIQAPYYPEFAIHNTYGIQLVNQTVYEFMKFACFAAEFGCLAQVEVCRQVNRSTAVGQLFCEQATDQCRTNVEGPYYTYGDRGVYDIRDPYDDPTPPLYFEDYLNLAHVQDAIGVNLNYTDANNDVYYAFETTGDFVYPTYKEDVEMILNNGVRVALFYGDADYICNWFGGQAISLAINYTHSEEFAASEYAPFVVDGEEYGEVRQYGNFSFLRIYEAGHEV